MSRVSRARIVAERLSFALPDGRTLLHDLSLSLDGQRTGLVGANGSGKTTLVRLLTGELSPTSGAVHCEGTVAVLPQGFVPAPEAPLAVALGIADRLDALHRLESGRASTRDLEIVGDDWDLPARAAAALSTVKLAHLPLERPLGALSGGEATRVALAGLLLARPDLLVLDEPTNHLDAASREALYAMVERWTGGVLCVSHDRALLRRMDRIVELSAQGAHVFGGNYDDYRARRDAEHEAARRELANARADLRSAEQDAIAVRERQARREAKGKRDRANANMPKILLDGRRAQAQATGARIRAVTEREVLERRERVAEARREMEVRERPRFGIATTGLPAGRTALSLERVTVRYPGTNRPVLADLSLRIVGPERVALIGPNGSGKSTLLRIATGALHPEHGTVRRLGDDAMAFLDQRGVALDPERTILANFTTYHPRMEPAAARHALARFLFSHEAALQSVATLSGGQRLRASLACLLGGTRPPSLLVLDEPTNHLDFDALAALEGALREYDGALLVASHDADFLEAIGVERYLALGG